MKSLTNLMLKSIFSGILLILLVLDVRAQTTIWSDNFNNGCASNCLATTWNGWTVINNVGGTNGGAPNNWFVSCAEEGIAPPGCGSSCIGDASLHIGANPGAGGDMGASFNETGATNATFRLAVSPTINTTGYSSITLQFDFIAFGSAGCSDDRAQLRLSADGGATWPAGYQYCLTSVCCGACNGYSQGQWTTYTLALPAAFDNNSNIRVGYHWLNNGNGSGTDPSVAIDDIRVTSPMTLAVDLLDFTAEKKDNTGTTINWKVTNEREFAGYELERSSDGKNFSKIYSVNGTCVGDDICNYSYKDVNQVNIVYYRLKMVDVDGTVKYSDIIAVNDNGINSGNYSLVSSFVMDDQLQIQINAKRNTTANFALYNTTGKNVLNENDFAIKTGLNQNNMNIGNLSSGVYILKIYLENEKKILTAKVIKN